MVKEQKTARKLITFANTGSRKDLQHKYDQQKLKPKQDTDSISSDSRSSDSADAYVQQFVVDLEEERTLYNILQHSDTESLEADDEEEEQEEDYDQAQPILFNEQADFFKSFGEVPNVDEISEVISIAPDAKEISVISEDYTVRKHSGKFVDPITGMEIDDGLASTASKSEYQQLFSDNQDNEIEASSKASKTSSRELLQESLLVVDTIAPQEEYVDETLAAFFELEKKSIIAKDEEIDWEALLKAEQAKAFQEHTLNFLNALIDNVVQHSEHLSPEKFLQKNLDKRKLMTELFNMLPNLQAVRDMCSFLNYQTAQYFRRTKSFRCIIEDSPNMVLQEKLKLAKAKQHLDQALAKEQHLGQVSSELKAEVDHQCKILARETENHIETFKNQLNKYFYREGFLRIRAEIRQFLLMMSKYREEISKVRFDLLLLQHSEAKLKEQIKEMDDLGGGLTMQSFTTLQAESQTLQKKIEERNIDLNKIYRRCRNNVHTLAHYKENQQMFYSTIEAQRRKLDETTKGKRLLRERLFSLKLQRNHIHDKMKKLRIQGGLLDKPDLMFDYDETVKLVHEKKEKVKYLRQTLSSIQSKLDQTIALCRRS